MMTESWVEPISEEVDRVEDFILDLLHSDNPELDEMCRYVIQAGGKRIRPIICILSHLACGGKDVDRAVSVGSAFEIVHSASLVHDDINDDGEIRRGRQVLHKKYTLTKALVAGDFMLVKGYQALGNMGPEVVNVIVKAASMMSESEFMQQDFERNLDVTEEDYFKIINGKTAMLINASALAGAYIATDNMDYINTIDEFSKDVGLAFQIVDDVLDVTGSARDTGKKVGIDITEGKPTLPVIYAMQDPEHGALIRKLYTYKDLSKDQVADALDLIKKTDAVDRCLAKADEIVDRAIASLQGLPPSQYRDSLAGMAKYIVDRDR